MPTVAITDALISDLRAALTAVPGPKSETMETTALPRFGSVYNGAFQVFAAGRQHYAMVRRRWGVAVCGGDTVAGSRRGYCGPYVAFSPITSIPHKGPHVLTIPAGIIPPKRGPNGERLIVKSYLLLYWRLLVSIETFGSFTFCLHFTEDLCKQAKRILHGKPPLSKKDRAHDAE